MITPFRQIRNGCRRIKWWFQRANGKLPPCDWWDYKYTLADFIRQGLEGLLHEGVTDWENPYHKKEKKDLEFVLQWAKDFPKYESGIVALDATDWGIMQMTNPDLFVYTEEEYREFEKRTKKAFGLLAKHYHTLWD